MRLEQSLQAWGTPDFEVVFKRELAQAADELPLQQGLSQGSYVLDTPVTVIINRVTELERCIRIRAGIFYQGIIAGCSCADDPTPNNETTEYCDVLLDIDRDSALTRVSLMKD
jgi:hypothetical protein